MFVITWASILVVTVLMLAPVYRFHRRRQVRRHGVSRVRAVIAPWLCPDLAADEQPGVPDSPRGHRAPSERQHLELAELPLDSHHHHHHLGCAS